jgi:hypothetical protein
MGQAHIRSNSDDAREGGGFGFEGIDIRSKGEGGSETACSAWKKRRKDNIVLVKLVNHVCKIYQHVYNFIRSYATRL